MKKSIQARNVLVSAGLVCFSFIVLSLLFSAVCFTYVIRDKRNTLDSTAAVVADVAAAVREVSDLSDWELGLQAASISRATGFHIFICDAAGRVVVCSDALVNCEHIGKTITPELLNAAGEGDLRKYTDLSGFYGEKRYVSAVAIRQRNGTLAGYVFAAARLRVVWQLWRSFTLLMLMTVAFALLIAVPVSVYSSRRETAPIKQMAEAARQFAKGDMSTRVDARCSSEEMGELCEAFNQMADALESSESRRKEFISSVSHELKTPMTTISGFADGLLDGTIPMESAPKYLSIISGETKRLSRLVRQMLDISRMKEKTDIMTSSFDASEALRLGITNLYDRMEAKRLQLLPEIPEDPVIVRGSGDDVARVIYNILENAVKFAHEGTELRVSLYKQGAKAYISIADHGETIPEDELPAIFDRFHKSDRSRSLDRDGVGLGLYIVKTILDQMGEDIWVRSVDGETEFRFSLTVLPGAGAP